MKVMELKLFIKKITSCQTTDKENINKNIENIFDTISNLKPREFWKGLPYKTSLKKWGNI